MPEVERCEVARRFRRVHEAFRAGDLGELTEALPALQEFDPVQARLLIGDTPAYWLVYAIYHSPLAFIRELLESGLVGDASDPAAMAVEDGFPPLVAALSCSGRAPGQATKSDVEVDEIVRLLLRFGFDPNRVEARGVNDCTPLHMAVSMRNRLSVFSLVVDGGADLSARTRIDHYETAEELAVRAGFTEIAEFLGNGLFPRKTTLVRRGGLWITAELQGPPGAAVVQRGRSYRVRLQMWDEKGEERPEGAVESDNFRVHRGSLMAGFFYGVEGMRIGGIRRLRFEGPYAVNGVAAAEVCILGVR